VATRKFQIVGQNALMEIWDGFLDRAGLTDPDLRSTVLAISRIPYGRPERPTAVAVIQSWSGTCSTKHLLMRDLFAERWPSTDLELWHRVYRVTPALARAKWGAEVASVVPADGLVDVHTYATARLSAEPVVLDVTFPVMEWDGESPMAVASGRGEDQLAGPDVIAEKQRLVESYCDAATREPFIATLSAAFGVAR
jgi:hypothetical protein